MHHNILFFFLPYVIGVVLGLVIIYSFKQFGWSRQRKQLEELDDAPFPFYVRSSGGNYYVVFELDENAKLWCDYTFGIREDGFYGIDKLKLEGFNKYYNRDVELKIGQSVFPLVSKIEKLTEWFDKQPFNYEWDRNLRDNWDAMKKKLNNLRYLESKSKEKEKKQK